MNCHSIFAIAALLAGVTMVQAQQKSPDPRVADLVQSGKLRVALFLPQYAKDSKTGEIRGIGSGIFQFGSRSRARDAPPGPDASG